MKIATKVLTRCSTICMAKSTFSPARAGGGQKPWTKFGCASKIAKNKNAGLTRCLVQLKSERLQIPENSYLCRGYRL